MKIQGIKEWMGNDARKFLDIRSCLEEKLSLLGFQYFYGGIVSKRGIYSRYSDLLGKKFSDMLVDFRLNDETYIFSPEYTFRVYDFLLEKQALEQGMKVFYSQEMLRAETKADIDGGKMFSFWQTGYELFGNDAEELAIENLQILESCLGKVLKKNYYFRCTDKRILESLFKQYSIENKELIMRALEESGECAEAFFEICKMQKINLEFAKELKDLMLMSEHGQLSLSYLRKRINTEEGMQAINSLGRILNQMEGQISESVIKLIPAMPKSWEAYSSFIFDARVNRYGRAIAGGGNMQMNYNRKAFQHSGAGIGVTRIVEYLLAKNLKS